MVAKYVRTFKIFEKDIKNGTICAYDRRRYTIYIVYIFFNYDYNTPNENKELDIWQPN